MSIELIEPLEEFLRACADARVQEKWISILRKPASNWKRLDVFELWMRNARGQAMSREFDGIKLADIAIAPAWSRVDGVHLYLVGRNRKNGHFEVPLLAALTYSMIEGVAIAANDQRQAFCIAHDGSVRLFENDSGR